MRREQKKSVSDSRGGGGADQRTENKSVLEVVCGREGGATHREQKNGSYPAGGQQARDSCSLGISDQRLIYMYSQ